MTHGYSTAPVSQHQASPGQQGSGISQDSFSWGLSELSLNVFRLFKDGATDELRLLVSPFQPWGREYLPPKLRNL